MTEEADEPVARGKHGNHADLLVKAVERPEGSLSIMLLASAQADHVNRLQVRT